MTPHRRLKRHPLPAEPAGRNVVLTTGASGVRRALAPTAWMVLEELLLRSNSFGGEFIADVSVRALGRSLGLSKDTVARAIRQLHGGGLVTVSQRRTDIGRFESGSYVLALPAGVTLAWPAPAVLRKSARLGDRNLSQLSLAIES